MIKISFGDTAPLRMFLLAAAADLRLLHPSADGRLSVLRNSTTTTNPDAFCIEVRRDESKRRFFEKVESFEFPYHLHGNLFSLTSLALWLNSL